MAFNSESRVIKRGIALTPFQRLMANNYGLILAGVNQFISFDQEFGSSYTTTPERQRALAERVRQLLALRRLIDARFVPGNQRAKRRFFLFE